MGYGDEIMGSGVARGAAARGVRVAFGDGRRIIWHPNAHDIFKGNPNVAQPGEEARGDLEWVAHYPGKRLYHRGREDGQWLFSDWQATPGEVFFTDDELHGARDRMRGLRERPIVIEPTVKTIAPNKQWPHDRYQRVANVLLGRGHEVIQIVSSASSFRLAGVRTVTAPSFRQALAVLRGCRAYIGPEGGMHHGAAALGVPGVVIFGGFTHPRNTGYDLHTNIFVGNEPCGRQAPCEHCRAAMESITVEQVLCSANEVLHVHT